MPHFLLCLYILQVVRFNMELNMILLDFYNTQSGHTLLAESFKYGLFLKLSVVFDLQEISAKCGLVTVMWFRAYILFFKSDFIYSKTILGNPETKSFEHQ